MLSPKMRAIALGLQTGVPIHSEGMPGEAKTSWAKQIGPALGREVVVLTPSIYEPTDIGGYVAVKYRISAQEGAWDAVPVGVGLTGQWWAELLSREPGVLVVDEIRTLSRSLQAVSLRLIFELRAGDTPLHPDTWILALSNPANMSPDGRELSAPLANRFCHVPWDMSLDTWGQAGITAKWDVGGRPVFGAPIFPVASGGWRNRIPGHFAQIFAFSKARPAVMRVVPKESGKQGGPFPTLRTWTYGAMMLAVAEHDEEVSSILLAGCVGPGPALEYLGWRQGQDLPDFQKLLENPRSLKLPKEGDRQLAILLGVVSEVAQNPTAERWQAGWEVLFEATRQAPKDVAAVAAKSLATLRDAHPSLPFVSKKIMTPFIDVLRAIGVPLPE